jgi:hypothetical protein
MGERQVAEGSGRELAHVVPLEQEGRLRAFVSWTTWNASQLTRVHEHPRMST